MSDHHLHSVIVSYNRLPLTIKAVTSYIETVSLPHTLWVVDNGSEPKTVDYLRVLCRSYDAAVLPLGANRFPGYATNRGWERMPPETTLLHRGDNDFVYLPGWCEEVVHRFKKRSLGQLGLRTDREEKAPANVGGNNVIRRELWDAGLRYDERPWGDQYPAGWTEDSLLSPAVAAMGWDWMRVRRPCIQPISREDPDDPYYQETWALRGITPPTKEQA